MRAAVATIFVMALCAVPTSAAAGGAPSLALRDPPATDLPWAVEANELPMLTADGKSAIVIAIGERGPDQPATHVVIGRIDLAARRRGAVVELARIDVRAGRARAAVEADVAAANAVLAKLARKRQLVTMTSLDSTGDWNAFEEGGWRVDMDARRSEAPPTTLRVEHAGGAVYERWPPWRADPPRDLSRRHPHGWCAGEAVEIYGAWVAPSKRRALLHVAVDAPSHLCGANDAFYLIGW